MGGAGPLRLRGTSVLAAPLVLVAVIGLSLAVASLIWAVAGDHGAEPAVLASVLVPGLVGAAALLAIRGCFVEVGPGPDGTTRVRDVAVWRTVRTVPQERIHAARVRRGIWRLYVLELDDGSLVKLVGASPQQFPAHLLPDAARSDMDDLDELMGDDAVRGAAAD